MSDKELPQLSPEAQREAEISLAVGNIISAGYDFISQKLDDLHKRNIHDDDVVKALRDQGESDILDWYAEWADIDLREDDNTTMNPVVPDPGDAISYVTQTMPEIREDANLAGEWTNGLATIELTRQHVDRNLIGTVWEARQPDAVFGARHLVITPAGLKDAGYRRVKP